MKLLIGIGGMKDGGKNKPSNLGAVTRHPNSLHQIFLISPMPP